MHQSLCLVPTHPTLQADNLVNVVDLDSSSIVLSHRLSPLNTPPMEKVPSSHLSLQEILIIGNCCDQVSQPRPQYGARSTFSTGVSGVPSRLHIKSGAESARKIASRRPAQRANRCRDPVGRS